MRTTGFSETKVVLKLSVICLLFVLLTVPAFAQERGGAINGVVTDETGAVIPDVTVTLTNVATGRSTTEKTDSSGNYASRTLEPGRYNVKFEVTRFAPAEFPNVIVLLGQTVRLDAKMAVGGFAQSVEVSAVAPLIDTTSTLVAHNVTAEEFDRLPKGRSFQALMVASPSVNSGQDQFGNIVGVEGGITVNGSSAAENQFFIDGVSTNSQLYGQSRQNAAFEFLQEVQVKTGGVEAEFGGALGGVMSAQTKSGGDEFHGEAHYYFTGDAIGAAPVKRLLNPLVVGVPGYSTIGSNGFVHDEKNPDKRHEVGGSIGGPIKKGKAWFFASASPQWRRRELDYTLTDGSLTVPQKRFDQQAFGKISYDPTSRLRTNWSILWTPTVSTGNLLAFNTGPNGRSATVAATQPNKELGFYQRQNSYNGSIDYTLSNRMLVSVKGGRFWDNYKTSGIPKITTVEYNNPSSSLPPNLQPNVPAGGAGFSNSPRQQITDHDLVARTFGNVDYALNGNLGGQHDFKAGWGITKNVNNVDFSYPNGGYVTVFWNQLFTSSVTGAPCAASPGCTGTYGYYTVDDNGTRGSTGGTIHSIYFQDKWNIHRRLTLTLGLRMENEKVPSFRRDVLDPAFQFGFSDKIMPRLGFAFDVLGNGKMKAAFSYSRFYDWVKYELSRGTFGGDIWTTRYRTLDTPDIFKLSRQNMPGRDIWDERVTDSFQDHRIPSFSKDCSTQNLSTCQIDPSLKPMGTDLYNASVEYQLKNSVIRVGYVHSQLLHAIEDMGVLIEGSENYLYVNPGEGLLGKVMRVTPGTATRAPADLCQAKLSGTDLNDCLAGTAFPTPKAQRKYDAVELSYTRRFSQGWFLNASYVISRLWGNYPGLANSDEIRTPTSNSGFGPGQQINTQITRQGTAASRAWDLDQIVFDAKGNNDLLGRLPTDRPNVVKLYGSYNFRFGTEIGAFFNAGSGTPLTTYAFSTDRIAMRVNGRGDMGRTPFLTQTDLMVSHSINVAEKKTLRFEFNMTNLFNQQTARHIFNCLNYDCINGQVSSGMQLKAYTAANGQSFPAVNLFQGFDPQARIATSSNGSAAFDPRYKQEDLFNPGFQGRFGVKFTF